MTVANACFGSKVLAVREVTVTSPESESMSFPAVGLVELLTSADVDMVCDER